MALMFLTAVVSAGAVFFYDDAPAVALAPTAGLAISAATTAMWLLGERKSTYAKTVEHHHVRVLLDDAKRLSFETKKLEEDLERALEAVAGSGDEARARERAKPAAG